MTKGTALSSALDYKVETNVHKVSFQQRGVVVNNNKQDWAAGEGGSNFLGVSNLYFSGEL